MDLMKCPWTKKERHALIGRGDQELAQRIEAPLSQQQVAERWEATVRAAEARAAKLEVKVAELEDERDAAEAEVIKLCEEMEKIAGIGSNLLVSTARLARKRAALRGKDE